MRYKKQEKRYLALDYYEWKELVNGINEYRKQVIDEGGYVDFINEILLKLIDAPTKKINIMEGSKRRTNFSAKSAFGGSAITTI